MLVITGRNEVVAKVIFLHLSVIHSVHRGGVASVHAGIPSPWEQTPPELGYHPPPEQTPTHPPPWEQTPPQSRPPRPDTPHSRHPPWEQTPQTRHPPREQTPPEQTPPPPGKQTPAYGLRAAGTHPTGMHSCSEYRLQRAEFCEC